MSSTKQQVINKFLMRYPDAGATLAATLFDDAHRIICSRVQCRNSSITVNLTAGQQEYQYDTNGAIVQVHEVYYQTAAGAANQSSLNRVSRNEIAALAMDVFGNPNVQTPGVPTQYYIYSAPGNSNNTGGQGTIGFFPPPALTTSTYPVVYLNVTTNVELATTDTVPVQLLNDWIYQILMFEMYCEQRLPQEFAQYIVNPETAIDGSPGRTMSSDLEIEKNIKLVNLGAPDGNYAAPALNIYQQGEYSKRTVVAEFLQIYRQCDPNLAYKLFDDQNRRVAMRLQLRNSQQFVNLVSGQGEYLYDPSGLITMIHSAYYWPNSSQSSSIQLMKISTDKLNITYPNWRSQSTGQPVWFYVDGAVGNTSGTGGQGAFGLYPVPGTSTPTGVGQQYPAVQLTVATSALMALDDVLPAQLLDTNVYVYGMCLAYAKRFVPKDVPRWINPATKVSYEEEEFLKNAEIVKNVIDNTYTEFQPGWLNWGFN